MSRHEPADEGEQAGREQAPDAPDTAPARFSCEDLRRIDRLAVEEFGVPSIVLMENAAIHLASEARRLMDARGIDGALIACGPGNNGGDGFALARHLRNAGAAVVVVTCGADQWAGDAGTNLDVVRRMGLEIESADAPGAIRRVIETHGSAIGTPALLVDCLLGTGLTRTVSDPIRGVVDELNALHAEGWPVLAADVPTGLEADTGRALDVAIRADVTVTFVGAKLGFSRLEAQQYLGEVIVAGIGAPRALAERYAETAPDPWADRDSGAGGASDPGEPSPEVGRTAHDR